jgi:hypothetical protein
MSTIYALKMQKFSRYDTPVYCLVYLNQGRESAFYDSTSAPVIDLAKTPAASPEVLGEALARDYKKVADKTGSCHISFDKPANFPDITILGNQGPVRFSRMADEEKERAIGAMQKALAGKL